MKKRVLIFCEFYRPGFKSGGGMWTVANLVDRLREKFEFWVVCKNHDGVGDLRPYEDVLTNQWNVFQGHKVFYADRSYLSVKRAAELVRDVGPEVIFLNSVFGLTSRMPLEARRKGWISELPFVVAPCGELSDHCLRIKPFKKAAFLRYAKAFGLYNDVYWKATSELEAAEIRGRFGDGLNIGIANDLVPRTILPGFDVEEKPKKEAGSVRLITVARIAPKKNIDYLIERLSECSYGKFELQLVGHAEHDEYWRVCEQLIDAAPSNVRIEAVGALTYPEVLKRLVESHFFVLPTLNENFGYVFVEAMAAGCPLLLSEHTIWDSAAEAGCGRIVPLNNKRAWVHSLEELAAMGPGDFLEMARRSRQFSLEWLKSDTDVTANIQVLGEAISLNMEKQGLARYA